MTKQTTQDKLNTIVDFITWMEENTSVEFVDLDYNDISDSTHYFSVAADDLINQYSDYLSGVL